MRLLVSVVLLLTLIYANECAADVYRYEDEDGIVHFSESSADSRFKLFGSEHWFSISDSEVTNKPSIKYPPKYSGDNLTIVIDKLKKLSSKAGEKGEFETTEEYNVRLMKIMEFNKTEKALTFVFKPKDIEFKYDADKKILKINIIDNEMTSDEFSLKSDSKSTGSYTAQNSFGSKITVRKLSKNIISLDQNTLKENSHYDQNHRDIGSIIVSTTPKMAKRMKGNVGIAITALPIPPFYKYNERTYGPTFNYPNEVLIKKQSLYVEITDLKLFNYSTGEFYGRLEEK